MTRTTSRELNTFLLVVRGRFRREKLHSNRHHTSNLLSFPLLFLSSAPLTHILHYDYIARRLNWGHVGGGVYMPMMFLSRVGSALPPSSTCNNVPNTTSPGRTREACWRRDSMSSKVPA